MAVPLHKPLVEPLADVAGVTCCDPYRIYLPPSRDLTDRSDQVSPLDMATRLYSQTGHSSMAARPSSEPMGPSGPHMWSTARAERIGPIGRFVSSPWSRRYEMPRFNQQPGHETITLTHKSLISPAIAVRIALIYCAVLTLGCCRCFFSYSYKIIRKFIKIT